MAQPIKKNTIDINAVHERHSEMVLKVEKAYEKTIDKIFQDLSPEIFKQFYDTLLEHENVEINTSDLVKQLKSYLSDCMLKANQYFFENNDVHSKLIMLEILKEKFQEFEGTDWNIDELTPEERTLPIRMQLKDMSIQLMQSRLQQQEKELKIAMEESRKNRERLQNINTERAKLSALMKTQSDHYEAIKPKLQELQQILNDMD